MNSANWLPCARLRSNSSGAPESGRNTVWRRLIELCDRAVKSNEIVVAASGEIDTFESVAMPVNHEGRTVGALLLRLREVSIKATGACWLRSAVNLHATCNARKPDRRELDGNLPAFVSARTSSYRLHAFDYLSGVMTEQKFGAHVLAEASDAYALAYLDGTVGYVNAAMLFAAGMNKDEAENVRFAWPARSIQVGRV